MSVTNLDNPCGYPPHTKIFNSFLLFSKVDGSIWGLNEFLELSVQSFNVDQSNLDCLLRHTQEIAQQKEFEDDFTILEVAFE